MAVILVVAIVVIAIIRTTDKHPDLAAIEGMDLVTLKLGMGAKGMEVIPDQKPTSKVTIDVNPSIEGGK